MNASGDIGVNLLYRLALPVRKPVRLRRIFSLEMLSFWQCRKLGYGSARHGCGATLAAIALNSCGLLWRHSCVVELPLAQIKPVELRDVASDDLPLFFLVDVLEVAFDDGARTRPGGGGVGIV